MSRTFKIGFLAVLTGAVLAASGCSSQKVGPRIPRASSPSSVTTEAPTMTAPATTRESVAAAPADLHAVDWADVPIPGDFCGIPGLVTLKGDAAKATSHTWGPVHLFRFGPVVYGDVEGDLRSEAAINVECDNGGGTAAGQLAFAFVVFEGVRGRLTVIGTVTPQKNPPDQHPTLLTKVQLARGRVIAHEAWYRPSDADCCPTGTAITVWTLRAGHLTPGSARITS